MTLSVHPSVEEMYNHIYLSGSAKKMFSYIGTCHSFLCTDRLIIFLGKIILHKTNVKTSIGNLSTKCTHN